MGFVPGTVDALDVDPTNVDSISELLGPVRGILTLRVVAKEHQGRILRIRSAKCVIGSAPSCTLRLLAPGVHPFHCLVLRGRQGVLIRRWSGPVCLNGAGITESWLQPGDRIFVGPIELEYLAADCPAVDACGARDDARAGGRESSPVLRDERARVEAEHARKLLEQQTRWEQQLAAAQAQFVAGQERWQLDQERWVGDERQLREQLAQAAERLEEATRSLHAARQRTAELEALLAQTARELSDRNQALQGRPADPEGAEQELMRCREMMELARRELQQEREEHQRVRTEWHTEREHLQHELAGRSQLLDSLQAVQAEKMQEAEFLIHSLQQEGKQLLAQLDKAKQELRRDSEHYREGKARQASRQSSVTQVVPDGVPPVHGAVENASVTASVTASADASVDAGTGYSHPAQTLVMESAGRQPDPLSEEASSDGGEHVEGTPDGPVSATVALDALQLQQAAQERAHEMADTAAPGAPPTPVHADDDSDEEGAIQKYMERLLKRVASQGRGDTADRPEPRPGHGGLASPVKLPPPVATGGVSTARTTVHSMAAGVPPAAAPSADVVCGNEDPSAGSVGVTRTRPEEAESLLAMRELANHSARAAIQSFDVRHYATVALGEFLMAATCLVAGGLILVLSTHGLAAQFGGVIGVAFGLAVLLRGCRKLLNCLRLKRPVHAGPAVAVGRDEAGHPMEADAPAEPAPTASGTEPLAPDPGSSDSPCDSP